jgi:tetratricopeptide (TPR) repeat protein
VGTTKLTRKEILTEDPVHLALIHTVEFFRTQGKNIAIGAAAIALLLIGIYFGLQFLEARNMRAQQEFSKGVDFYHAQIDPTATDNPYDKGPNPVFRSETARYQAAGKVSASVISGYGSSKVAVLARYYQGLCQMQLGQKDEAIKSLEGLRNNTKDRTTGYLARKVVAGIYLQSGNAKGAQELLEGMIGDPQCELPKEELKLQLAQVYTTQGKKDQALKLLREARDQAQVSRSMLQGIISQELTRMEGTGNAPVSPVQQLPVQLPAPR